LLTLITLSSFRCRYDAGAPLMMMPPPCRRCLLRHAIDAAPFSADFHLPLAAAATLLLRFFHTPFAAG